MTITPARRRTHTSRGKRHRVPAPPRHAMSLLPEPAPNPAAAEAADLTPDTESSARHLTASTEISAHLASASADLPARHASAVATTRSRRAAAEPRSRRAAAEPRSRRAPVRRTYLRSALLRCSLYLGPLSVAVAAAEPLSRVAWPVPIAALLLGWTAAQALTSTGAAIARHAGPSAAARLVGYGFAAVAALWCALVWIAPGALVGPERGLALVIGLGGLASLATVTAALVTRSEAALIGWSLPCWLLAAATLAGLAGDPVAGELPIGTLLPAAIVVTTVRAFRPVVIPGLRGRMPRPTRPELRRGGMFGVIGASQAICVGLLWQAGPSGSTAPFWLPLLLAVPILEALIGWHTDQVDAGLDTATDQAAYRRHVRGVTLITLAGLLPPLAVGVALAVGAYQLPADAGEDVLGLAGGTLLGGVFAVTFLLAARGRTGLAATLAVAPPLAVVALPILPLPAAGPLPDAVAVLAATHLAGLLVVAMTAADDRRAH
ncbi:hypothetical protein ACQP2X_43215 [Actinoplanes sp. CA-131856]